MMKNRHRPIHCPSSFLRIPFNYVDKNVQTRIYGYELMQALAGYTEWKFEYVKCDWSDCFDKLENGEIDIMVISSYTDERAQRCFFG